MTLTLSFSCNMYAAGLAAAARSRCGPQAMSPPPTVHATSARDSSPARWVTSRECPWCKNLVSNWLPDKLCSVRARQKQNHLKLAISIGMRTWTDPCSNQRGDVPPGGSEYVARRIKALRGELTSRFGCVYCGVNVYHGLMNARARSGRQFRSRFSSVSERATHRYGALCSSTVRRRRATLLAAGRERPRLVRCGADTHQVLFPRSTWTSGAGTALCRVTCPS